MSNRRPLGLFLIALGIVVGVLWASGRFTQPSAPVAALFLCLLGAGFFTRASRFGEKLLPLVGKNVRVQAWGAELPGDHGSAFVVHSVQTLGAGVHIYLRPSGGSPIHLKIAQPTGAGLTDRGLQIDQAKYIQWAGKKLQTVNDAKALVLTLD